jgi:hypothetical protein
MKAEKTKFTFMTRHQNAEENRDLVSVNKPFENVENFQYLRMAVTNRI